MAPPPWVSASTLTATKLSQSPTSEIAPAAHRRRKPGKVLNNDMGSRCHGLTWNWRDGQ
jgi:hypothetical protein